MATGVADLAAGTMKCGSRPFSIRDARLIIKDDFVRKPHIYWIDLLATLAVAYPAAGYFLTGTNQGLRWACFLVAGLALFRAGTFIHEIVHMGQGVMVGFKTFWNLFVGVPLLMPSYLYECHIDHHAVPHYGTRRDGEYLPLGAGPVYKIFLYISHVLVLPLGTLVRFLFLTPISFVHPELRTWVLERASSYVMNPSYRRELPASPPRKLWALIDWACFLRAVPIVLLVLLGLRPWMHWVNLYLLAVFIISLNTARNIVAHHYSNEDGEPLTHEEQLFDSINITGRGWFTELLFPLGLRYHALHHLFGGLPYHSLGTAHRRLMAELPADSPYRDTVRPSFLAALGELFRDAAAHGRRKRLA